MKIAHIESTKLPFTTLVYFQICLLNKQQHWQYKSLSKQNYIEYFQNDTFENCVTAN